jgi:lipoprotein-anchoring transpeptidase ErfK/SrfK
LVAAYPVTIGSAHTTSPIGEWKVRGVAKMPWFRYDKQMLQHGWRSRNFHLLSPGPNSPVGVIWIALNKRGIGLHGTNEPETIGRAASHGCVRLTNWDVVRLAQKVKADVPVSIH